MFIGSRVERNQYSKIRNNKEIIYSLEKEIFEYICNECGAKIERSRNGKDMSQDKERHYCLECFRLGKPGDFARQQRTIRIEEENKNIGFGGRKVRGRKTTRYIEVFVGKDSWHHKNPDSPKNNGCVREHIYVMQESLGHRIPTGYVVHHIDGDKWNNSIENLVLMTMKDHNNAHAKSESLIFQLVKEGKVSFNRSTNLYEFN